MQGKESQSTRTVQASQVRQTAAENLGRLSGMSARVDALANDLVGNAQKAAVGVKQSYLVALQGVLASSGQRLTPATLIACGTALQELIASAGAPNIEATDDIECHHDTLRQ